MMIRVPKENRHGHKQGCDVCPVVQGYPLVIHHSDEPEARHGIPFDHPSFHFTDASQRRSQTKAWVLETFGLRGKNVDRALDAADAALSRFSSEMHSAGRRVQEEMNRENGPDFAVVLAGRPYHADNLINHHMSRHFTQNGIPVLSLESIAELDDQDISNARMDSYNPFHTRMLAAARYVAAKPNLELVQIVSFGCGHDAILSDEVNRILSESSDKELLVLKLDEGEASGPLTIRIKSFIETVKTKRSPRKRVGEGMTGPRKVLAHGAARLSDGAEQIKGAVSRHTPLQFSSGPELSEPFTTKFTESDKERRTILIPVLSEAFSYLCVKFLEAKGFKTRLLPTAGERAIALGKKYVHNDICYPAQINIGEMLAMLETGEYAPDEVAVGLSKNCTACRAGQYSTLARKALDDAGYRDVPIITTGEDTKNMHPGFRLPMSFQLNMLWGLTLVDAMEYMRQTTRPYELNKGETDRAFQNALEDITENLLYRWRDGLRAFDRAVRAFNRIPADRSVRKPRVGIIGEILLNFHEGSNGYVQRYLEDNGMETVIPGMSDFFRKKNVAKKEIARRKLDKHPALQGIIGGVFETAFDLVSEQVQSRLEGFRFFEEPHRMKDVVRDVEHLVDPTFTIGEGWLMPGEIIQMAKHGVDSFVILSPFACLPNHITGRGMIKTLKREFPHIRLVALDYDPDTSFANIENRLQMLIMDAKGAVETRRQLAAEQTESASARLSSAVHKDDSTQR